MIKTYNNRKVSPKVKAQDVLFHYLTNALDYWGESDEYYKKLTEKDKRKVQNQMIKQVNRIAKMFGFEEISHE